MMELDEREVEVVHVKRLQLEPVGLNGQCLNCKYDAITSREYCHAKMLLSKFQYSQKLMMEVYHMVFQSLCSLKFQTNTMKDKNNFPILPGMGRSQKPIFPAAI